MQIQQTTFVLFEIFILFEKILPKKYSKLFFCSGEDSSLENSKLNSGVEISYKNTVKIKE